MTQDRVAAWWDQTPWNWLRRVTAVGLLAALTAIVVLSYLPGALFTSCREQLASGGAVVSVCGPIGTADIVAVGLVLIFSGLLVWPELSEFGVSGLITLKRRVDETQQDQRATADTVRNLALAQEVPDLGATRRELTERLERWSELPDDVRVIPTGARRPSTVPDSARVITEERADHEDRLLQLAHEIDDYLRVISHDAPMRLLTHPARSRRLAGIDLDDYLAALRRWSKDFQAALRDWAAVRNVVVHYPENMSDDEVRDALALGQELLTALERYLPPGAPRYGAR